MTEFISYEKRFSRECDFVVEYEYIFDQEGYVTTHSQGMRSDFCYEDGHGILNHMIWPEFEDAKGNIVDYTETPIANRGRAKCLFCGWES